ncbi:MAG: flagellar motor switch protein FliN, partial [Desulfobacterales bacterium]|nr:flagellar motor switch protein FliN [Desulfobacterales bacterium]
MENNSESNPTTEKIISEDGPSGTVAPLPHNSNAAAADGGKKKNAKSATPTTAEPPPQKPAAAAEEKTSREAADGGRSSDSEKRDVLRLGDGSNLDIILDIPLDVTVELGRTKMPIRDLLQLGPGSAVPLSRLEGEPVDILANNKLIARGVVLVKDEKYGIRITEITGRLERLRGL